MRIQEKLRAEKAKLGGGKCSRKLKMLMSNRRKTLQIVDFFGEFTGILESERDKDAV